MALKRDALIIGLTGPVYSGCSKIAKLLCSEPFKEYEFKLYSLSDILKQLFKDSKHKDPLKVDRSELQDFGNELRNTDRAFLVKKTLEQVEADGIERNVIIDSIRNSHEVYELRKLSNFFLFAVNASFDTRFNRASEHDKEITKHQFFLDDYRDSGIDEPAEGQQVQICVDLADFLIINNDDIKERKDNLSKLTEKLNSFLNLIKSPGSRYPEAVELGMNYAYCASTMSRCLQRSVGAAITMPISEETREEKIISIGCNNPPTGVKDCNEMFGKCYRKKLKEKYFENLVQCPQCKETLSVPLEHSCGCTESKMKSHYFPYKNLDYCLSLHAEENAILQALHSTALGLEGTVLYTSTFPCLLCAKKIIQVGIKKIYYSEPYPIKESLELLQNRLGKENIIPFAGVKSLAFYRLFRHL